MNIYKATLSWDNTFTWMETEKVRTQVDVYTHAKDVEEAEKNINTFIQEKYNCKDCYRDSLKFIMNTDIDNTVVRGEATQVMTLAVSC